LGNIQNAWLMGDVNFDGVVDGVDFGLMQANMAASQASPLGVLDLTPVPEAGSLGLLILGVPALLVSRKRRRRDATGSQQVVL
jgi:hypothetical protein